jgi:hypothetical protein
MRVRSFIDFQTRFNPLKRFIAWILIGISASQLGKGPCHIFLSRSLFLSLSLTVTEPLSFLSLSLCLPALSSERHLDP